MTKNAHKTTKNILNKLMFTQNTVDKIVLHRNYFNRGLNEVNSIRQIVQLIVLIGIFLNSFNVALSIVIGICLVLVPIGTVLCWLLGWYLDKLKLYDRENEFNNARNPLAKEIRSKL